jgi:outer membrane murein-binding lipoprotein Lpp
MRQFAIFAGFSALFSLSGAACLTQPTGIAKAQEIANEANLNARFGRIEIAAEQVAPTYRAAFSKAHSAWGNKVRVVDSEMLGIRATNDGATEASVAVRVNWYRPEQQDMRSTLLRQQWKVVGGDWKLTDEVRADGDIGLLGERIEKVQAPAEDTPKAAKFRTIKLTGEAPEEQ